MAVYSNGSISRAAEQLFLSQPALSRQIAALEVECGVRLFDRQPTGTVPTAAGTAMFRQARAVVQLTDSIPDLVRSAGPVPETVDLGLAPGLPPQWIAELVTEVRRSVPTASLVLMDATTSEQIRLLRDGRLDIGITHQAPPPGLVGWLLRTEPFGVALAPEDRWKGKTGIRGVDLDGVDVLAHARDQVSDLHDRLVVATQLTGARPRWHFRAYTENASACALATGSIASVQTRTSALRLLPEWKWVPLVDPAIEMETWIIKQPSNRAVVDAVAGISLFQRARKADPAPRDASRGHARPGLR